MLPLLYAIVGVLGFRFWKSKQSNLPDGIVAGNGRLEGKLVDVAAKEPLRVKEVLVEEGAVVTAHNFLLACLGEKPPMPDAPTSANWTMVGLCAHESAMKGGERVKIPQF